MYFEACKQSTCVLSAVHMVVVGAGGRSTREQEKTGTTQSDETYLEDGPGLEGHRVALVKHAPVRHPRHRGLQHGHQALANRVDVAPELALDHLLI